MVGGAVIKRLEKARRIGLPVISTVAMLVSGITTTIETSPERGKRQFPEATAWEQRAAADSQKPFSFAPYLDLQRSLWLFESQLDGATATINGVDTRCPQIPFTFIWGDGEETQSFFPATHPYADTSRNYTLTVIAHYGAGEGQASVDVTFVAPDFSYVRLQQIPRRVTIPSSPLALETTMPGYHPPDNLSAFTDSDLVLMSRDVMEYALDVGHYLQMDFCKQDVDVSGGIEQVILKQTEFGGCGSLWFTKPISFICHPDYLGQNPDFSSLFHEMGHNITLNSPEEYRLGGKIDGPMNAIFSEGLANIFQHATIYEILNHESHYGLSDDLAALIRRNGIESVGVICLGYGDYLAGGCPFTTYNDPGTQGDETFNVFMTVAYTFMSLAEERGDYRVPLKRMMALFQTFNESDRLRYQKQENEAFRGTFVVAALSHGFENDLREKFRQLNFPISDAIYEELMSRLSAGPVTWYVDSSVSEPGDGQSWEATFKTIQEGIDASNDGDTVMVAEGTYVENIQFNGKNIVLTSTNPLDPSIVANTVIDGNEAGSVVTFSGTENDTCVLSGFTLKRGKSKRGGGVYGAGTKAIIRNNVITQNSAIGEFWGEYGDGGGLYSCNGTICNNVIAGNTAQGAEQWDEHHGSCSTPGYGGGLCKCGGTIQNNIISGNTAGYGGGLYDCDGTIRSNLICGNDAVEHAEGFDEWMVCMWESGAGGGSCGCDGTIVNNTIVRNSAYGEPMDGYGGSSGGALIACTGIIQNCIIWGNSAPKDAQLSSCSPPTYSCIEGWAGGGEGNTDQDPMFLNSASDDYRLEAGSPCIDGGLNEDWMSHASDLDGNPRIWQGRDSWTADIGAYECGSSTFKIAEVAADTNKTQIKWNSRPGDAYTIQSCIDLSNGQWNEEETIASEGTMTSWTDLAPLGHMKFYRIEMK